MHNFYLGLITTSILSQKNGRRPVNYSIFKPTLHLPACIKRLLPPKADLVKRSFVYLMYLLVVFRDLLNMILRLAFSFEMVLGWSDPFFLNASCFDQGSRPDLRVSHVHISCFCIWHCGSSKIMVSIKFPVAYNHRNNTSETRHDPLQPIAALVCFYRLLVSGSVLSMMVGSCHHKFQLLSRKSSIIQLRASLIGIFEK